MALSTYLVRIVLIEADQREYDDLHKTMDSQKFPRKATIAGKTVELPHAMYVKEKTSDDMNKVKTDVSVAVQQATRPKGRRYQILIAKTDEMWQENLTA